jgi:hypothetical protein
MNIAWVNRSSKAKLRVVFFVGQNPYHLDES